MIDVVTTAVLRSEILEKTYASFKENLFKDIECRLFINIDPVGDDTADRVYDVAKRYFKRVFFKAPNIPNFSKAFVSVFTATTSDYVFNLEDDWILKKDIDIYDMIRIMDHNPKLAVLRLPYRISTDVSKNWNLIYDEFTGEYFRCPRDKRINAGFCGHPSLIRGDFIRDCVQYIDISKNPEKQFHQHGHFKILHKVLQYDYGVYQKQNEPEYIEDIGRKWLQNTNWQKKGIKAFFNVWEKTK